MFIKKKELNWIENAKTCTKKSKMFWPHQCRKHIESTHVAGDLETVCIHANKKPLGLCEHLNMKEQRN